MKSPFFSIVIPTYNRAELLGQCLKSVIAQTYSDWEAIVVDNFSDDNTEEVVCSFNDPRIRYVKIHNNGIISVSRNKALDMAEGEWICFLDSDDSWFPNKLSTVKRYTQDYDIIYHGYRPKGSKMGIFSPKRVLFYDVKETTVQYVLSHGDPFSPSCTAVSLNKIGKSRFCEDRSLVAAEDYDFFLQLIAKGVRVKWLKEVLTNYDVNGISLSVSNVKREREIYKRWAHYLDDKYKMVYSYYIKLNDANCLRVKGDYQDAINLYKEALKSPDFEHRKFAFSRMLLCVFLQLKSKLEHYRKL